MYAALEKLAAEGFVHSSRRGTSKRWTALSPEELIKRLREQYNDPLDVLLEELPKLQNSLPPEPFSTVPGIPATHKAAISLIDAAQSDIHISCWQTDLEVLREALTSAHERGVRVFGMLYGSAALPPGSWLHHHYEEIVGRRVDGRLLALVADEEGD